jgi:hypothetical protein
MSHLFNKFTTFDGAAIDAFSRLRTSQSLTLFDSDNREKENGKWSNLTANGTVSHISTENSISLEIGQVSGDKIYRETRRVFPYQPGKSLLVLNTAVFDAPKENLRQRMGYFSLKNGIFLENESGINYFSLRSESLDTTLKIPQNDWNGDKCDGTGESGFNLDVAKGNIFWVDIEWLGVGDVRCGFFFNGRAILAHTFENTNNYTSVYMSDACLPIRYEIENIGSTSSNSIMKQICSSVISEGGYEERTEEWSATRTTAIASTSVATGYAPVVSIRMAAGKTDSIIIPSQVHIFGDGNNAVYEYVLIRNANITGGDWVPHTPSTGNIEYNINATSMNAGTIIQTGLFTSTALVRGLINTDLNYNFAFQLGRDQTPTSDTMTLAVRHLAVGGSVYGSLNWFDLS